MYRRPFHVRLWEALDGLYMAYRSERNLRIQVALGTLALAGGFLLDLPAGEWLGLLVAVFFVLALELVNSAVESVVDLASPGMRPLARYAKHVAAGSVLMGVGLSLAVAGLVLWPRLLPSLAGWHGRVTGHPGVATLLMLLVLAAFTGIFLDRWAASPRQTHRAANDGTRRHDEHRDSAGAHRQDERRGSAGARRPGGRRV